MSNQVFLTSFLIALSCNLDNVGVGLSYGTRGIRVLWSTNLFIALLTAAGTYLAMLLGQQTFLFISPSSGAILGGGILIVLGVWVIVQETLLRDHSSQIRQPHVTKKNRLISHFGNTFSPSSQIPPLQTRTIPAILISRKVHS